jgi:hypothetical protein
MSVTYARIMLTVKSGYGKFLVLEDSASGRRGLLDEA